MEAVRAEAEAEAAEVEAAELEVEVVAGGTASVLEAIREHLLFFLAQASHAKPRRDALCGSQGIRANLHAVQAGLSEPSSQ